MENNFNPRVEQALNYISLEPIKKFVIRILEEYSSVQKREIAADATILGIEYLKKLKRYRFDENRPNKVNDVVVSSILLHNVFFDASSAHLREDYSTWKDLFQLREITDSIYNEMLTDKECGPIIVDAVPFIYQCVEAQLGEDMPVPACRPVAGQTTHAVFDILFFYYATSKLWNDYGDEEEDTETN